jgi:hypothetical protein
MYTPLTTKKVILLRKAIAVSAQSVKQRTTKIEALDSSLPLIRKEFKMSALGCRMGESAVVVESEESLSSENAANRPRYTMSALACRKIAALSRVRKGKVLTIRQQLDEGIYYLDERMDAVLERLLENLTAQDQHN